MTCPACGCRVALMAVAVSAATTIPFSYRLACYCRMWTPSSPLTSSARSASSVTNGLLSR